MSKRDCLNCGEYIPFWKTIDGKKRGLSKRKYCLTCSPFGARFKQDPNRIKSCPRCGKEYVNRKNALCGSCNYKTHAERRIPMVYGIVGTECWKCGYNKGLDGAPILEFHHIDPSNKLMNVGSREIAMYKWERITQEINKCVLLCCRCHREAHYGFISEEEILGIRNKHNFFD